MTSSWLWGVITCPCLWYLLHVIMCHLLGAKPLHTNNDYLAFGLSKIIEQWNWIKVYAESLTRYICKWRLWFFLSYCLWAGCCQWYHGLMHVFRVVACCLTAPSHYLNQYYLTISYIFLPSWKKDLIGDAFESVVCKLSTILISARCAQLNLQPTTSYPNHLLSHSLISDNMSLKLVDSVQPSAPSCHWYLLNRFLGTRTWQSPTDLIISSWSSYTWRGHDGE